MPISRFLPTTVGKLVVVANASERDLKFPTPESGEWVFNRHAGSLERFNGTQWIAEVSGGPGNGILNVRAAPYNAKGDGRTDDGQALQAAHDALPKTGGTIFFPPGVYSIASHVTLSKPVKVIGLGGATCRLRSAAELPVLTIVRTGDVEIRQLGIEGSGGPGRPAAGIEAREVNGITISDCHFFAIRGSAVALMGVADAHIIANHFAQVGHSGVRLETDDRGAANRAIWIVRNHFEDVNLSAQDGHAAVQSQANAVHETVWICQNHIERSGTVGIGLDAISSAIIAENVIIGNGRRGEGIAFTGSHVQVHDNCVHGCGSAGIMFWGVEQSRNEHVSIAGNTCYDNRPQGIAVVWATDRSVIRDLRIIGNRCFSTGTGQVQEYGVQAYRASRSARGGSWQDVLIAWNQLSGNHSSPYNLVNGEAASVQFNVIDGDLPGALAVDQVGGPEGLSMLRASGGTPGESSVQTLIFARHRDNTERPTNSEVRIAAGFDPRANQKIGGLAVRSIAPYANRTALELLASKGPTPQDVVPVAMGDVLPDGRGGFGPSSSAWNGVHLRIGDYHLWVDADAKLRMKRGIPDGDQDGAVVGS